MTTVRYGDFEWDEAKARANVRTHGVTFEEAATVFLDDLAVPYADPEHIDRLILVGMSLRLGLLLVVFAERAADEVIRIISARGAPHAASGGHMKKATRCGEPSAKPLRAFPEVDFSRLRRGRRGTYAHLLTGAAVRAVLIDRDLWDHFGSARAVNAALRTLVGAAGKTKRRKVRSGAGPRRAA